MVNQSPSVSFMQALREGQNFLLAVRLKSLQDIGKELSKEQHQFVQDNVTTLSASWAVIWKELKIMLGDFPQLKLEFIALGVYGVSFVDDRDNKILFNRSFSQDKYLLDIRNLTSVAEVEEEIHRALAVWDYTAYNVLQHVNEVYEYTGQVVKQITIKDKKVEKLYLGVGRSWSVPFYLGKQIRAVRNGRMDAKDLRTYVDREFYER